MGGYDGSPESFSEQEEVSSLTVTAVLSDMPTYLSIYILSISVEPTSFIVYFGVSIFLEESECVPPSSQSIFSCFLI